MISFGADRIIAIPRFPPTLIVQGHVHHKIGSLLLPSNSQAQFLQVYFMGDDDETDRHCRIIQGVERATVLKIQKVMHDHNVLVHEFKAALENMPVVIDADRVPSG